MKEHCVCPDRGLPICHQESKWYSKYSYIKLISQYSFSLNFQNGSLDCECKAKGPKRRSPRDLNRHLYDVDTLIDEIFNMGDKWIYSYKYSCNSKNTWINMSN